MVRSLFSWPSNISMAFELTVSQMRLLGSRMKIGDCRLSKTCKISLHFFWASSLSSKTYLSINIIW